MSQRELFHTDAYGESNPAPSHEADPDTSRLAAARHANNGKRQTHGRIVYALVVKNPSLTGPELWEAARPADQEQLGSVFEVYRRLSDLRRAGLVKQGDSRKCAVKGARMVTWAAW